jgi:hypothetical protein
LHRAKTGFNIACNIPSLPEIPRILEGTERLHGRPRNAVANFEDIDPEKIAGWHGETYTGPKMVSTSRTTFRPSQKFHKFWQVLRCSTGFQGMLSQMLRRFNAEEIGDWHGEIGTRPKMISTSCTTFRPSQKFHKFWQALRLSMGFV